MNFNALKRIGALTAMSVCAVSTFASWNYNFDEAKSELRAASGNVKICGKLSFVSGGEKWSIADSRDGVSNRLSIVDGKGNVQGYISFPEKDGEDFEIHTYHRTAQNFGGELSFDARAEFPKKADTFACRTRANSSERVLGLSLNSADSLANDSVFSVSTDTVLRFDSPFVSLKSKGAGVYDVSFKSKIDDASASSIKISLIKDYLKNRYIPYYRPLNRSACPKTPTGWMSWNTYFDKATAEDNLSEAKIGKKWLQPFGCDIWSIESWQGNSDQLPVSKFWHFELETNEKQFPEGMKKLAADIRALGFRPGIWMSPFGTGNPKTYKEHKDWFLHDKNGVPVKSWCGLYTLDPTVPEVREHLKEIFRTASRDWGYEFFKIDGMSGRNHGYCAHLYERPEIRAQFKDPKCKNPFELCIKAFRDGIGSDRIFLACQGHTSGVDVKYADACRTGADIVHPNEPVKWANVLNQAKCSQNQLFAHNIVSVSDPDTLLVKDLPTEEARVSATIIALPGQFTFFGDKLAGLDAEQMKMLQQTLPPVLSRPQSLYPYFKEMPIWKLSVKSSELGEFNVVALFNWSDDNKRIEASATELGISPNVEYVGCEFWTGEPMGKIRLPLSVEVPAHGVRIVSMHKIKGEPQWIGSDRHIAMNGGEIKTIQWNPDTKSLDGTLELIGKYPVAEKFYIPSGFEVSKIESPAFVESTDEGEGVVSVVFALPETSDEKSIVPFSIRF